MSMYIQKIKSLLNFFIDQILILQLKEFLKNILFLKHLEGDVFVILPRQLTRHLKIKIMFITHTNWGVIMSQVLF